MTHQQLFEIKNFAELFADPRFIAAITYLREHPSPQRNHSLSDATLIIRSEGAWHGWFEALKELENLGKAPSQTPILRSRQSYSEPHRNQNNEH